VEGATCERKLANGSNGQSLPLEPGGETSCLVTHLANLCPGNLVAASLARWRASVRILLDTCLMFNWRIVGPVCGCGWQTEPRRVLKYGRERFGVRSVLWQWAAARGKHRQSCVQCASKIGLHLCAALHRSLSPYFWPRVCVNHRAWTGSGPKDRHLQFKFRRLYTLHSMHCTAHWPQTGCTSRAAWRQFGAIYAINTPPLLFPAPERDPKKELTNSNLMLIQTETPTKCFQMDKVRRHAPAHGRPLWTRGSGAHLAQRQVQSEPSEQGKFSKRLPRSRAKLWRKRPAPVAGDCSSQRGQTIARDEAKKAPSTSLRPKFGPETLPLL